MSGDPPLRRIWNDHLGWISEPPPYRAPYVEDAANQFLRQQALASIPIYRPRDVAIGVSVGIAISTLMFLVVYFVAVAGV